ncbi:MAG: hypothetical protein Tsb002_00930 [Wenzhouxiangellaceae bacterium]
MLINATQPEELRVAIADGQRLLNLDIETPSQEQKKANIYKGRITRIEPSLEACFVDYGSERHGFLPLKEISPEYYRKGTKRQGRVSVREAMEEGQEIIIQVDKEERGNKGAALTTYISLAGRYLVLMPNNPEGGGVSRRIIGEERRMIRESLDQLNIPDKMSVIIRTAGVERAVEELQWDLDYLLQLWAAIEQAGANQAAPFLVYQESNLIIRALRDYFRDDIGEILVDDDSVFNDAREFMQMVMPQNLRRLKLYKHETPLFSRFQIESQIESAFSREVRLPSGGALVIDHTEALLSIDINSARATKGSDIEDTAFKTNLEAADEVARQLRIRDLGGLVVIDFIDMNERGHQRAVEDRLREALKEDRARIQLGRISRFGLMEMSRQRLRPSLGESSQITCPRCSGHGTIRSIESLALALLRLIEEEAMKEYTGQVITQAPMEVANFLLNEKREQLHGIEERNQVPVIVVANPNLETPRYDIKRVRQNETIEEPSYQLISDEDLDAVTISGASAEAVKAEVQQPAVQGLRPTMPAPTPAKSKQQSSGLMSRISNWFSSLFAGGDTAADKPKPKASASKTTTSKAAESSQRSSKDTRSSDRGGKKGGSQGDRQQGRQQQPRQQRRGKRGGRKDRDDATTASAEAKPVDNDKNDAQKTEARKGPESGGNDAQASGGKNQNERRRGRRGGRRRRGGQNRADNRNDNNRSDNNRSDNRQKEAHSAGGEQTVRQQQSSQQKPASADSASHGNRGTADKASPHQASAQQDSGRGNAGNNQTAARDDSRPAQAQARSSSGNDNASPAAASRTSDRQPAADKGDVKPQQSTSADSGQARSDAAPAAKAATAGATANTTTSPPAADKPAAAKPAADKPATDKAVADKPAAASSAPSARPTGGDQPASGAGRPAPAAASQAAASSDKGNEQPQRQQTAAQAKPPADKRSDSPQSPPQHKPKPEASDSSTRSASPDKPAETRTQPATAASGDRPVPASRPAQQPGAAADKPADPSRPVAKPVGQQGLFVLTPKDQTPGQNQGKSADNKPSGNTASADNGNNPKKDPVTHTD